MNTIWINNELKDLKIFRGTYPKDVIPILEKPMALVINTDSSHLPGQHWVALYLSQEAEYLDSFGRPPFKEIIDYCKKLGYKSIKYSNSELQSSDSMTCGAYCVLFLKSRCNKMSFEQYLKFFAKSKKFNDSLVVKIL